MKRTSYFIILLVFALCGSYIADAEDVLPVDQSAFSNDATDASSMTWPMLPGESVQDLARLFYPNNKVMRQQFVAKTLRLNSDTQLGLKAATRFDAPTLLAIPTLKSLAKNAVKVSNKSNNQSLKMSYGLKQVVENIPQKLLQQYEELVNKNAFLKEQLARLSEKLVLLQSKLDALKLTFDNTLTLPNADLSSREQPTTKQSNIDATVSEPVANVPTVKPVPNQPPVKKVFKNLNNQIKQAPAETSFFDRLNTNLVKTILAIIALLLLGALVFTIILKKYQERMFDKLNDTAINVHATVADTGSHFEEKKPIKEEQSPAVTQQVKVAKDVDTRLSATLEEAKLLISVNRATDAIAHLKATIASQPKASISHWLYLLDLFRRLNMKDDFEQYADRLHLAFNVMTPVWYEKPVEIYVPQSLEEFPHIMEQLYGMWPDELASVYLRDLFADNRGGDRVGFGKEVLEEILMLIAVFDTLTE